MPKSTPTNRRGETALDVARRTHKIAELMASEMIDINAARGACTNADLRAAGFSEGEILAYGLDATALAEKQFVRQAA